MDKLEKSVKDVSNNYYEYFFNLQNVNGVGYGYKYINNTNTLEPCIQIFVENKINKKYLTQNNIVPKTYMGIKTDIIKAKEAVSISKYIKSRPIRAGGSVGYIGADGYGTICCIVKKKFKIKHTKEYRYEYYLLSNNHVIAHNGEFPIGTLITQPGVSFSLTKTSNIVAMLDSFIPIKEIKFGIKFKNIVDCAIAKLIDISLVSNKVFGLTEITGVAEPELNMRIKTSGATSGIRQGTVETLHLSTVFKLVSGKRAFFKDQISLNLKSAPGDSGSPILTFDNKLIGIATAVVLDKPITRANDINNVLKFLNVEVYTGEDL